MTDVSTTSEVVIFRVEGRVFPLKMITTETVETAVINSLPQEYANLEDLSPMRIDFPGFKPFTLFYQTVVPPAYGVGYIR